MIVKWIECDTENGWRLKRKVRESLRVKEKGNDKKKGNKGKRKDK